MKVELVIPVYNEEPRLADGIRTLEAFFQRMGGYPPSIVIADNGSTDQTWVLAVELSKKFANIRTVRLAEKGRGRALKKVWLESQADILAYMDVDISTDLAAFPSLIEALTGGGFDLATGSRLKPGAVTGRCWQREVISRIYNLMVKAVFHSKFSDAQCGFKAITCSAAQKLLPLVEDTGWFFDTELLVLAEKLGFRIFDLPVRWVENCDSRVKIVQSALAQMKGLVRLKRKLAAGKYAAAGETTT